MAHSNQIREFLLTDHGIELRDVYVGPSGVLTGSMRLAQEARESAEASASEREKGRRRRELERRRAAIEAQLATLQGELEAIKEDAAGSVEEIRSFKEQRERDRAAMAASRKANEGNGVSDAGATGGGDSHEEHP